MSDNIEFAVSCALFVFALYRGAGPERWASGAVFMGVVLEGLHDARIVPVLTASVPAAGRLLIDLVLLIILLAVALRANRLYPLWLGATQIVTVAFYFTVALVVEASATTHAVMADMMLYMQLCILILGQSFHLLRQMSGWRSGSPISSRAGAADWIH